MVRWRGIDKDRFCFLSKVDRELPRIIRGVRSVAALQVLLLLRVVLVVVVVLATLALASVQPWLVLTDLRKPPLRSILGIESAEPVRSR